MFDKNCLFDIGYDNKQLGITYNGKIDFDMISILRQLETEHRYYTEVADTLSLNHDYVELILHVLSHYDLVEYGTSPRGSWITDKGRDYLKFIDSDDKLEWLAENKKYNQGYLY